MGKIKHSSCNNGLKAKGGKCVIYPKDIRWCDCWLGKDDPFKCFCKLDKDKL